MLCVLAWVVEAQGASAAESSALTAVLAALFFFALAALATRPHEAVIGYKG